MLKLVLIGSLGKKLNNLTSFSIYITLSRWSYKALMLPFLHMDRLDPVRLILCLVKGLIRIQRRDIMISYLAEIRPIMGPKAKLLLLVSKMSILLKREVLFQELFQLFFKD